MWVGIERSCRSPPAPLARLPRAPSMYNWAPQEVVRCRPCTGKADLYSLCAIIQELYTGKPAPDPQVWVFQNKRLLGGHFVFGPL